MQLFVTTNFLITKQSSHLQKCLFRPIPPPPPPWERRKMEGISAGWWGGGEGKGGGYWREKGGWGPFHPKPFRWRYGGGLKCGVLVPKIRKQYWYLLTFYGAVRYVFAYQYSRPDHEYQLYKSNNCTHVAKLE